MNIKEVCNKYVEEYSDQGGQVVCGTTTSIIDEWLPWTSSTWEDGVPVTKMFGRCEQEQRVILPVGTKLYGVSFIGLKSGSTIFDFYLNGTWYRAGEYVGEHILDSLDSLEEEV